MQICLFPLILAILFFGGYNYPGMSWVVESGELILVIFFGFGALFIVGSYFSICGFVGLFQDLDTIN
jgi:NADH-quinone oxidoreductase subunit H